MKDFTKENGWVHDMVMACRQDPNSADINGVALYHIIELIRQDEREAMGVKVRAAEFIAAASKAPDAIGRPIMWAEFPTRGNT
jgi:hypothetical protein